MILIHWIIEAFVIVLVVRVILSYIPDNGSGGIAPIRQFTESVTEPVLAPVRRLLPPTNFGGMGLDLSPMIVMIVLQILASTVFV